MAFQVKKAKRNKVYAKIALMAPSGGGKTYGALRLSKGMAEEIEKETGKKATILMANTESSRGYYYANEFEYDIVDIDAPHNPEKYIELINFAVDSGYDILIIDSTSHEWEGKGGCLELQQQAGGTYNAWAKVTPRHNRFISAIAESPIHIIATMRGKDQYEMEKDDRGRTSVKKLGVGAKQRDGFEYEFTCTFLIDQKSSMATPQKDNTHLFENDGDRLLSETDGAKIIKWANDGDAYAPVVKKPVEDVSPEDELKNIKTEIIDTCNKLGGQKNTNLMNTLREHVKNGNPMALKTVEDATKCLNAIKALQ